MKNLKENTLFLIILSGLLLSGCGNKDHSVLSTDELYALFKEPPAEARPFVRWWWNGDCIEVDELERELDVMKASGIGGVEINPIAMPEGGDSYTHTCYEWLSPEWNQRVKATTEMARARGMVVDLIMGSGWPFGGEFLKEDQFLQGVGIRKIELEGPRKIVFHVESEWQLPGKSFGEYDNPDAPAPELFFLQMIPHGAGDETSLIDLKDRVDKDGNVEIYVPEGKYDLFVGTHQSAYRSVMHGAPGSRGPVVDHYDAQDVREYMDRLADALEALLGGKLGDHLRALFCDSIELSGANITDDFFKEFLKRRGYDLKPFAPLVYYNPYLGYNDTLHYTREFNEDIKRVRYDFNATLVELFQERFIATFDNWANEHGMQSRFQAYGMPWLMGMLDGYRMVDIPESNNWLFSPDAKSHGYWIWNKYASSGAHLSGSSIVSSEAMTNTRGVFRTTLDMIKINDDFNFISGINHSILHGYNYSPPAAGFPGWVRYGTYFSDQNSWWPYFKYWADYNARLSALFQNSSPVVDVAIMTPDADIWREWGLYRVPFYTNPWYNHDLWEGFSRHGISADYINEGVIRRAVAKDKEMKSEAAGYQLVIIPGATYVLPETATAIEKLARQGVKFLFLDHMPSAAPSYFKMEEGDRMVQSMMSVASSFENVMIRKAPAYRDSITSWTGSIIKETGIKSSVTIAPVDEKLYLLKYKNGSTGIYFFSNQDDQHGQEFTLTFSEKGRTAWCWDPHTGERFIYPAAKDGRAGIRLQPLESILIVLEEKGAGQPEKLIFPDELSGKIIGEPWKLDFYPTREKPFEIKTDVLFEFGQHADQRISTFAGRVSYSTAFDLEETGFAFLDLGIEHHITEARINGTDLGVKWWGRHLYPIPEGVLKQGENQLQITYTTTLANYANSLSDNTAAKQWIHLDKPDPMGLKGEVKLLKQE